MDLFKANYQVQKKTNTEVHWEPISSQMPVYAPLNAHDLLHHGVTKGRRKEHRKPSHLTSLSVPHYVHPVSHLSRIKSCRSVC
jgi:hypothetical protein